MEKIYRVQINKHGMPNFATAKEMVDRLKGRWVYQFRDSENEEYRCSVCSYPQGYEPNFCPNCGADMRQTENKDEKL